MKRFTAFLLALIMVFGFSSYAFADESDFSAWNEMRDDPDNCDPGMGVAAATEMKLYVDRNGKTVTDPDGNQLSSKIKEAVVQKFYAVMMGVPVNWDRFDHMEFEAFLDLDGNVTFRKQIIVGRNGLPVGSRNAEIAVFDTPTHFHAASSGETEFITYDFEGNELGSSPVKVRMISTGEFVITSTCPRCGEEQEGTDFHLMPCGHYSCEVGKEGHGAGDCGEFGHLNCDGKEHYACPNCLKPLCSGDEHGIEECKHVHNWIPAGSGVSADKTCWVNRFYCAGCQTYSFGTESLELHQGE